MAEDSALIPEPVIMYKQPETKDVKDLSTNLVSGDFERQYRDGLMEKPSRRHRALAIIGVVLGVLTCWMLIHTLVREVQITRLRHEVDELTANMIALTANVKSVNQKLSNNRLFTDSKFIDDTIYTDDDDSPMPEAKSTNNKDDVIMGKLGDVTIENDDIDDEDMIYDDDDEESGDYYMDYDKRTRHDGTPSYVRLNPDDITDAILNLEKTNHADLKQLIGQLNENPENPNLDIPSIKDSIESQEREPEREKRSVFPESSPEDSEHFETPKSVSKDEERRKTKKFTPGADDPLSKVALHSITRTVRSDEGSTSRGRPFIAAHFHGNTSHLNVETHEHYKGNGLLRVPHDKPHDVWYPSPWTMASPHPRPTLTRNGHVKVHHTGVYLVYVQIYYLDSHDIISWVLHRTNSGIEGRETLLQCAQSTHSSEPMDKPNSCFSAAALFLKAGDRLAVRNTGGDRHSLMQPEKSFIGLIKLADAEDPNDDY